MKTLTHSLRRPQNGFTLIELMLIVLIFGILAAIALVKYGDSLSRGKEGQTKAILGTLRSTVAIYYTDNEGVYPTRMIAGLTEGGKYLESVPQTRVPTVPSVGNPGHDGTGEKNQSFADDDIAGGFWIYDPDSGAVFVNCLHKSSNGAIWSTF